MDEDAVIAGALRAATPGLLTPLEITDEVIVLKGAFRDHAAVAFPADAERAIWLQLVDFLGVTMDVGLRVDVVVHLPVTYMLEEVDDLGDGLLRWLGWEDGDRLGGRWRLRPRSERAEQDGTVR